MKRSQAGFTIIELMIATTVLSFMLLLITAMMTGIGNLYYKGITQSHVQNNTRSIIDQLTQDIQLSSKPPSHGIAGNVPAVAGNSVEVICAGSVRYTYIVGVKIGSIQHVMWRDNPAGGCVATVGANISAGVPYANGTELIGPNSRIAQLDFPPITSNLQTIHFGVAYGENDLLTGSPPICKGDSGQQFCATAYLNTVVVQRISNN